MKIELKDLRSYLKKGKVNPYLSEVGVYIEGSLYWARVTDDGKTFNPIEMAGHICFQEAGCSGNTPEQLITILIERIKFQFPAGDSSRNIIIQGLNVALRQLIYSRINNYEK